MAAPRVATSVSYRYHNRAGVISSITLRFSDSYRTLEVSGRSQDQVEAVANLADTIVVEATTLFGGYEQRSLGGFLLFGIAMTLVNLHWFVPNLKLPIHLALMATGCLCLVSVWLLPWDEWFPGLAVYRGDASFFVRNAAIISFLGLVATLLSLFWGVASAIRSSGKY